eukprot:CAMPEP_0184503072 /NCGR_PEP_ID=MMETSP0113_2-20130426/51669_1 /TAXON_ID=91329 /ORGANISM="Norrisiella sphaerica, Strain BC52" /LENGTH=162 /DNA_ID=CAMNT_0026892489 /DNA_START=125 /DNA_END=614 /DNA_ORIENTATION=-
MQRGTNERECSDQQSSYSCIQVIWEGVRIGSQVLATFEVLQDRTIHDDAQVDEVEAGHVYELRCGKQSKVLNQALPDKIGCEDARKERSPMDDSSKTPPNILLSTILAGVGRSSPVMSELALSSLSPRYGPNAKKPVPKLASTNGRVGSGFWSLEPGRRSDA